MSESIVRKVQPFTIGTRLSIPSVPKEFPQSYLPGEALDNCVLQHNLNSLYLSRSQVCAHGSRLVLPIADEAASMKFNPEHVATEDQLNQNIASPSAISRSIKKITISGSKKQSNTKTVLGPVARPSPVNSNNNNNITNSSSPDQQQPRIVGVSCENNPKSQFKVLLGKESSEEPQLLQGQAWTRLNGERSAEISAPEKQNKELQRRESQQRDESPAAAKTHGECFTQQNSLFNKEALQAEAWIKGKLQDLKDGCNVQYCPLQDWEEAAQTLQRDLKDFENTLIQLNQLGEQLICKLNPTSDLVKKQLSQLREQWQNLRQMAANQTRALGAARNLQEFNKKLDKLEAWIKQKKEEEQSLVSVLGENVDKMQLTRRILDLKQDEQLHRNLHEEINNLALKLEKLGKAEGKNITMRKKHINKMWLKIQTYLKNYHENLQMALEISSLYQQADNTLDAMNNMRRMHASNELENFGDREIRDIASQIMMLDVSVSQLPKLPQTLAASVTRKQAEVKECWALLQKDLRSDRTTHSLPGSTFTREDADLLTPVCEAQCITGSETHGIMGKEVKEEQNRLKGCRSITDCKSSGPAQRSQHEDHQSVNRSSSPEGDDSFGANEPISTHEPKGEREARAEPRHPAGHRGHPQLHLQLQKFTLSADKTLSWLKDNVSMATQVCLMVSSEGLEAARRCQQSLEQEILKNRARIEVVKREGHGLVRAQHPGSSKIEEFLSQLEVLWEELRRRHQRNAAFLQASEKLGFRVVKVLQALGSLEAWLESVELSMKASALAGDPETMSRAEKESCLLEKEVAARSVELNALRHEVDRLHGYSHPHTQGLAARMEELERKYHCVLSALTQQSSELQDTRMLTEFLERLELEDSQELNAEHYHFDQPLHSDISSVPTSLVLQISGVRDQLIETMGDPVEELREAVEMLNNTVRERGRSQSHDHAVQKLLSKHAGLAVRVEECLCSSKELSLDILEKETDMAVQCEPEHSGFEPLQDRLGHLEIEYEIIREEVKEMEKEAFHLKELCLEKAPVFEVKIHSTLQAWSELGKSVMENRSRLQEFVELRSFFRSYLALISWTEDTRSCIFSDTALHLMREGQRPLVAELDVQIEQKFKEFDALATKAKTLLDSEHHLTQMVKERMEELRSMLGWISVHWRAQKQQRFHQHNREEPSSDNIYSEATVWNSFKESLVPELEDLQEWHFIKTSEDTTKTAESNEEIEGKQSEDDYEIMNRISPQGGSPKANMTAVKESSTPPASSAVNLILSFGNTGDSQVQVLDLPAVTDEILKETSEPVHRVSAYLHVKNCILAPAPVYESITLPRQKSRSATSDSPTLCPSSSSFSSQSSSVSEPQTANVSFHPSRGSSGSSIFCSLKRMGKKRKRKRDERRHTIQRIMGVDEQVSGLHQDDSETVTYDTQTWPLKEGQRKKSLQKNTNVGDAVAYMKNPLLKDIDSECSGEHSITPYAVSSGPSNSPSEGPGRNQCRVLSLGSVLSFDLPKDLTLIPGIQDIITIAPPESKTAGGTDADPLSQRNTILSSFKQTHVVSTITGSSAEIGSSEIQQSAKDLPDEKNLQPSLEDPVVTYDDTARINFSQHESTEETDQSSADLKYSINEINKPSKLRIYMNELNNCPSIPHKHECVSVHTLIRDLNGHQYHKCTSSQCEHVTSPHMKSNQASHVRLNLKSTMRVSVRQDSVDSGISTSSSFKLSTDTPCLDQPLPKGVVGKIISLEVGGIGSAKTRENSAASLSPSSDSVELNKEPLHVDHQQFEEEEEELEDIWNQNTNYRQSICSDIMYQPNQDPLTDQSKEGVSSFPSATNPPVLYRNLVTASAPNLLIAEFKLPPNIQNCLGYEEWQSSKDHLPPLATGDRRSWAAFPNREPVSKTAVVVNETASDPVKLPEVGNNPRYVYQYREEDEGEQQEEVDELTSCLQKQSTNRLSVHMGLNGACQPSLEDPVKPQEEQLATGGRCFILSGKPDLQSMEGTLERKNKLQLGGKKAASRGWNSYHAVLYRQTLCFFQDRKETLRSSACGLPLNLIGAECSPAPDYTKKPNCFRLRLRDGSEYLFNTASRFMMKKWIMKIQASTGQSEFVSSPTNDVGDQGLPLSLSLDQASGQCPPQHKATHTFPRLKKQSIDETKEIVIFARDQGHMLQTLREDEKSKVLSLDPGCYDGEECGLTQTVTHRLSAETKSPSSSHSPASSSQNWLSSKHRSHSFTSATYQRINPILSSPGAEGMDKGSNYCVTLVVGGSSTENASVSRSLEPSVLPLPSWQPDMYKDSTLKSYSSLPRARNKSVFKKFFGRKEP